MKDKIPEISKEKQKLLFRIKRIRGQFAAVERALEAGDEGADILMLLAAIRGGVNGLMAEILEDHIRLHMMTPDQKMESPGTTSTSDDPCSSSSSVRIVRSS